MFLLMLVVFAVPLMAQDIEPLETSFNWWPVISAVLAILSTIMGKVVVDGKKKIGQVVKLGIETVEALDAGTTLADYTVKAAEDNVFTDEEKAGMKDKALAFKNEKSDVKAQWKIVWAKKVATA